MPANGSSPPVHHLRAQTHAFGITTPRSALSPAAFKAALTANSSALPSSNVTPRSTMDSSLSMSGPQNIDIVAKKDRQVTAVDDWKPYSQSKQTAVLKPVVQAEVEQSAEDRRTSFTQKISQALGGAAASKYAPGSEITRSFSSLPSIAGTHRGPPPPPPHAHHGAASGQEAGIETISGHIAQPPAGNSPAWPNDSKQPHKRSWQSRVLKAYTNTALRLNRLMISVPYMAVGAVLSLISLFGKDFDDAFLPPTFDTATDVILTIIFVLFSLEIVIQCVIRPHYMRSFYFVLDVIGTVSLIFDISFILNSFWSVDSLNNHTQVQDSSSSSKNNHISQSTSMLQVTKFSRILRVLRLIRVVRIFKFGKMKQHQASKVGLHLSELIDRRVILMLLGLLVVIPFFTVTMPDDLSQSMGLAIIDNVAAVSSAQRDALVNQYLSYEGSCIYLYIAANPPQLYLDLRNTDDHQNLRSYEMSTYNSDLGSTAIYSVRGALFQAAIYNMSLTILIILMFGIGTVLISKDVHRLVVAPLERMTGMIKKLAGTICVMNGEGSEDGSDRDHVAVMANSNAADAAGGATKSSSASETKMIEAVIEKMALIFAVQPDASAGGSTKAMQMMAGSKHTEIRTDHTVVSIEVVERPRERTLNELLEMEDLGEEESSSGLESSVSRTTNPSALHSAPSTPRSTNRAPGSKKIAVDLVKFVELATIEGILASPVCLGYFRMYMTANLMIENLLFYQEIDRFRTIMHVHMDHIWNHFISTRAVSSAINIPDTLRDEIHLQLMSDPRASVFNEAQIQVYTLMLGHWSPFLDSKFCQAYVAVRYEQLLSRGMIDRAGKATARAALAHAQPPADATVQRLSHEASELGSQRATGNNANNWLRHGATNDARRSGKSQFKQM